MTKDEALKMAISQFKRIDKEYDCTEIIDICKEALEQPAHNDYITITKASYFAMENQIHTIRQDTVKKCADLVMDWESIDLNITAGQRIMGKLYD